MIVDQREVELAGLEASRAAVSLWLAARERSVRTKLLAAVRSEQLISIDGTRKPFLALTAASGHWVAVRHHGDLQITVAAGDLDPGQISIEPIADPAGRLLRALTRVSSCAHLSKPGGSLA